MPWDLHYALCDDEWDLEEIERILQRDSSSVNKLLRGVTPLHLALWDEKCSVAIVKLLLHYGADPNSESANHHLYELSGYMKFTPLYIAVTYENCKDRVGIVRALVEGGAKSEPKNDCCLNAVLTLYNEPELEIIRLLLGAGADLLTPDTTGDCPLVQAIRLSSVSTFRSLLYLCDVDVNIIRNQWDGSLLHSAVLCSGSSSDFVKVLLDRGIEVNSVDQYSRTPLHLAVEETTCESGVIDMLLRKGALVCAKDFNEDTALDLAITSRRDFDVFKLLLQYSLLQNPNIDIQDLFSWSYEYQELFSGYVNDCKNELQRMNSEKVGDFFTLFEFVQKYSGNQMSRETKNFNLDHLLQIISNKLYPLYSNVISSKFSREVLEDKLEECNVRTVVKYCSDVRSVTREVSLNYVCACVLANYLDETDLLSVILAFC